MKLKQIKVYKGMTLIANIPQGIIHGDIHKPVTIPYGIWDQVKIFNTTQNKSLHYGDWTFTKDWM